jgi:hypothetical protein
MAACRVVKNRYAQPYLLADIPLDFNTGIDRIHEIFALGQRLGIITESGEGVFHYNGRELGREQRQALEYLRPERELLRAIYMNIREKAREYAG